MKNSQNGSQIRRDSIIGILFLLVTLILILSLFWLLRFQAHFETMLRPVPTLSADNAFVEQLTPLATETSAQSGLLAAQQTPDTSSAAPLPTSTTDPVGQTLALQTTTPNLASPVYQVEVIKPALRAPDKHSQAVCNDGTPFSYILRESPSNSRDWVVHIPGEGFCASDSDCLQRLETHASQTTTVPYEDGARYEAVDQLKGLMNPDSNINPIFYDANIVQAHYCSSDLWSGTWGGSTYRYGPTNEWLFRGRFNLIALFDSLAEQSEFQQAQRVLIVGTGMGGIGVSIASHFLYNNFAGNAFDSSLVNNIKIIVDGTWIPHVNADAFQVRQLRRSWSNALNYWSGQPNVDCVDRVINASLSPVDCLFGDFYYSYLITPTEATRQLGNTNQNNVLIQQSMHDPTHFRLLGLDPQESATMSMWQEAVRASIEARDWYFMGTASYHTLSDSDAGLRYGLPGQTFNDVILDFWSNSNPNQIIYDGPPPSNQD